MVFITNGPPLAISSLIGFPEITKNFALVCADVYMVAGNNDIPEKFSDQNDKAIISNLKKSQTIEINNQLISVEHGDRFGHHADHNGLRQSYPDSKLIT